VDPIIYVTITRFTRSAGTVHSTRAAIVIALDVSCDCRQNGEARAGTSHHVRGCHRFQFWRAIKIIPNEKTFIYKTIAGRGLPTADLHHPIVLQSHLLKFLFLIRSYLENHLMYFPHSPYRLQRVLKTFYSYFY
jgi:hypothetical protein